MSGIIGTDGAQLTSAKPGPSGLAVGRIVHFFQDEGDVRKPDPRVYAGIVTKVHDGGCASLTLFMPDHTMAFVDEAPYHASTEQAAYRHMHWSWPPRVGA